MGPDDAAELQYDGTAEMEYVRVVEYVPTGGCSLSEVSRKPFARAHTYTHTHIQTHTTTIHVI